MQASLTVILLACVRSLPTCSASCSVSLSRSSEMHGAPYSSSRNARQPPTTSHSSRRAPRTAWAVVSWTSREATRPVVLGCVSSRDQLLCCSTASAREPRPVARSLRSASTSVIAAVGSVEIPVRSC